MASKNIGDEAVTRATGRGWAEWLALLDKAGAKKMAHRDLPVLVSERLGAPPWWSQMVTVTYERERGLRQVHETAAGYVANVSRTFAMPVGELFDAFRRAAKKEKDPRPIGRGALASLGMTQGLRTSHCRSANLAAPARRCPTARRRGRRRSGRCARARSRGRRRASAPTSARPRGRPRRRRAAPSRPGSDVRPRPSPSPRGATPRRRESTGCDA